MPPSKDLQPNTAPFFPNIFLKNQFCTKPVWPPKGTDLSGKTAIVTGANSGLGFECCRQLLSYKLSRVILATRSQEKGEAAAALLKAKYPGADITVWQLDMCSYPSIQAFVNRVGSELSRVDYIVLNAGLISYKFKIVPSTGHEEVFQVNYLSTALLTLLLLPVLKDKSPRGSPSHLTILNSGLSLVAKFENSKSQPILPSFDDPETFDGAERYNVSKLLYQFFLWKLAEHVSGDDVVVSTVDPGYVKGTDLGGDAKREYQQRFGVLVKVATKTFELTARSLEVGTSAIVDAVVNKGKESHGSLLLGWSIVPFAKMLYTPEGTDVRERLWQETLDEFKFADVDQALASMKRV